MKIRVHHGKSLLLQAAAALVVVQMLMAVAMAASPALHLLIHHDADHADHECAVTHLINGDFGDGLPVPDVAVAQAVVVAELDVVFDNGRPASCPLSYMDGVLVHAPPVAG